MLNRKKIHTGVWITYFLFDYSLDMLMLWQRYPYRKADLVEQSFLFSLLLIGPKIASFYLLLDGINRIGFKHAKQKLYVILFCVVVLTGFVVMRQLIIKAGTPYIYHNPPVYYAPAYHIAPPDAMFSANRVGTAIMDFLIVCGLLSITELYIHQVNALFVEKNLIKEKLQSELNFLKAQVNPHFLFNTLNNIYALARKQSLQTPEAVLRLSQLLRFTLYETQSETIPIETEIKIIEDYILLEQMRYNDRLSVSFKKAMAYTSQQVAPLILLPFVENAFKHGVSETRKNCYIDISLRLEKDLLFFQIKNSKNNIIERNPEGNLGLKNVRRQLELIYPGNILQVVDETESYAVNLTIDLKDHVKL